MMKVSELRKRLSDANAQAHVEIESNDPRIKQFLKENGITLKAVYARSREPDGSGWIQPFIIEVVPEKAYSKSRKASSLSL